MKNLTLEVTYNCNSANSGETVYLTLCGVNKERVTLELTEGQIKLVESRRNRSFYIRCKKEKILQEIESAANGKALEELAKKYYLCDACALDDINLYGAKNLLKVVVQSLYKYPKLRSKLCYLGTHEALEKLLVRMERGDKEVLNAFNLQYICSEENAKKLGGLMRGILTQLIKNHEAYVANAMCAFGLFDAILLDKNDYEGYAYLELASRLRQNEGDGFHPKGCNTPESVVYHELGHLLDDLCALGKNAEFKAYYESLTAEDIKYGLSEYACTSPQDFIAEAFSESMCNPAPGSIATQVKKLLDKAYNA
ncbi:MAG: hypothetical protein NC311_07850 [Muribaculaceae bacterium]|nr:hypothetical protein [Muribaculaceae bacterium]MCM1440386.1 hypothetical protein [Roseburia sp.]